MRTYEEVIARLKKARDQRDTIIKELAVLANNQQDWETIENEFVKGRKMEDFLAGQIATLLWALEISEVE